MKLYYSPRSPFVRKVMVVAREAGIADRIETIDCEPAKMDPGFVRANPIARIPTLVTDDGLTLPESHLIAAYLDSLHAKDKVIPVDGKARWTALRQEAIADGFMEAAVGRRDEAARPEGEKSPANLAKLMDRMNRCLDALDAEVDAMRGPLSIGQIAAACACGYADFRYPDFDWRKDRPKLAGWYQEFSQRPSMQATIPSL